MPSIVETFISKISSSSGCYEDVKASFAVNKDIKNKKATLGKRDIKLIVETMYEETREYPELNKLWGTYTNILQYNNKEVRRLIVERLVEKDVEGKKVCPHRVLELLFKDKEMVKLVKNKKIYFQAALQVKELCPTYLSYLGGDNNEGKRFRGGLGDYITDNYCSFFIYNEEQDLSKRNEEVSKCIEDVLNFVGVSRSRLHQIDDCDIVSNFLELKRICSNIDINAFHKGDLEKVHNHSRPIKDHELCNFKNLISNYEKGRVKKEIFLENLYNIMLDIDKRENLMKHLERNKNEFSPTFSCLNFDGDCDFGEIFLENLYNIMLDIDKREELMKHLERNKNEFFPTFSCLKFDGDCDFGVIPKEIIVLYTADKTHIRKMSKNMEFRNLCYLTTGYDYDESESEPYSFWHRKPLRDQQRQEMLTRLVALYDITLNLNNAMSGDPENKGHDFPIFSARVAKC
uniref:HDAC_interact domain-containing protein n=1 Tax=Strongyloides papillosus TaxID=174720 RepID=A0A0N5C5E0_STREA